MTDIKQTTIVSIGDADMCRIISEAICRFGPFDDLIATEVTRPAGEFRIKLDPKPTKAEPKK
jgi:hypothetical protein